MGASSLQPLPPLPHRAAVALPAGFLADRHRRDRTLALGALLGLLAGSLQLLALVRYPGSALWLGAAMAALGAYSGWTAGPLEAIFADSTSAADRQRLFTAKYVALTLACAAGPLVGLAGFVLLGNRWTTQKCVIGEEARDMVWRLGLRRRTVGGWTSESIPSLPAVLVAGLALMLPSLVMLLMFNDDATLVAQERRQGQAAPARDTRAGQGCPNEVYGARMAEVIDVCPEPCSLCFGVARHPAAVAAMKPEGLVEASRPLVGAGDGEAVSVRGDAPTQLGVDGQGRSASPSLAGERDEERGVRGAVWEAPAHVGAMNGRGHEPGPSGSPPLLALWGDEERGAWQGPRSLVVPGLILASDVLGALAAGMTVRFVVLFMTERYDMRPITVSLLGALGPGVVALFSWLSGPVARVAGALEVNLWWRVVDIVLMLAMAAMPERPGAAAVALGVVHVVRMGAANCSRPLLRAILMDNVPPEVRRAAGWAAYDDCAGPHPCSERGCC